MTVSFEDNLVPLERELPSFLKILGALPLRELEQNKRHLSCLDAYSEALSNHCVARKRVIDN